MVVRWTAVEPHTHKHVAFRAGFWMRDDGTSAPVTDFKASLFEGHVDWKVAIIRAHMLCATTKITKYHKTPDLHGPQKSQVTYYVAILLFFVCL